MLNLNWRTWIKAFFNKRRKPQNTSMARPRFRPQLEVLEDRRLLATLTVNSVVDAVKPDNSFALREAIQVVNGTLTVDKLSAAEQKQIDTSKNPLGTNDIIQFNIGGGTQTIAVTGSVLDAITKSVTIDGTAPAGHPDQVIVLDGKSFQDANMKNVNGLTLKTTNITINNLTIQNFTGYGVEIDAAGNSIASDTITGNNSYGVWINNASGNKIGTVDKGNAVHGNLISSNKSGGVRISGANSTKNVLQGNTIINNTGIGISLLINANTNTIGTDGASKIAGLGNTIAGNTRDGISITSKTNTIGGNYIGIQQVKGSPDGLNNGNGGNGISVYGNGNAIGGDNDFARNIISRTSRMASTSLRVRAATAWTIITSARISLETIPLTVKATSQATKTMECLFLRLRITRLAR